MALKAAVIESCKVRLATHLMTSLATLLGMIPAGARPGGRQRAICAVFARAIIRRFGAIRCRHHVSRSSQFYLVIHARDEAKTAVAREEVGT